MVNVLCFSYMNDRIAMLFCCTILTGSVTRALVAQLLFLSFPFAEHTKHEG